MNLETIRLCAEMAARQQLAALGNVGDDVQELLDEVNSLLVPDEVIEEAPVAKAKTTKSKAKAPAAPAEVPAEAPADVPAAE